MNKYIVIVSLMVLITVPLVYGKEKAPVRFDAFDGGRVGARAQGMGFAFTAIADNADAPFWNPAGLSKLPSNLFTVSLDVVRQSRLSTAEIIEGEPLRGRSLTYLAFAGQNGALGFRPMADIDETIILDAADPNNNFERRQVKINSFFISAGSEYNEAMTIGLNIHYLNGRLSVLRVKTGETNSANIDDGNGYTLDWSLMYNATEFLNIGITGQNLPGAIFWGDYAKTILPAILRVGVAMELPRMLILSYDYEKRFYRDGIFRPRLNHFGIEQALSPYLRIRGGIYGEDLNEIGKTRYTAGLGFVQKGYFIDIAMEKYDQEKSGKFERVYDYLVSFNFPFSSL